MNNDSPPESYYVPPDFDDDVEHECRPRGQGCMSDREYILFLEDAIMNSTTESKQPCGFCDSEVYGKHTDKCAVARIEGYHWMELLPSRPAVMIAVIPMPVWASEDGN